MKMREVLSLFSNWFKFFNLPTSQFAYNDEYLCYQSRISKDCIKFFMVQSLLYIFYMLLTIIYLAINIIILFRKQTDNSFPPKFAPSLVSNSRQNLAVVSSLVIPSGWFLSYLFLWIYFKLDKGFFSGTNMRFKYGEYKTGEQVTGDWEDLNEFHTEEEN